MKHPKQPQHTPGPWHAFAYEVRDEKHNVPICTLTGKASGYRDMTEDTANQCLISAAPDLLAASKAALHYYLDVVGDTEPVFIKELQAAIKKAEGRKS